MLTSVLIAISEPMSHLPAEVSEPCDDCLLNVGCGEGTVIHRDRLFLNLQEGERWMS